MLVTPMDQIREAMLFYLFAGIACGGALGVALGRDLVRSAVCLMLTLGAVAGLFFAAGAVVVGVIQLLVYVGGILVLLVFGIMLTSPHVQPELKTKPAEVALAASVCLILLGILLSSGFSSFALQPAETPEMLVEHQPYLSQSEAIGASLVGIRVESPGVDTSKAAASHYLLAFELVSVHLLVVLVAAAYFARTRRRRASSSQP